MWFVVTVIAGKFNLIFDGKLRQDFVAVFARDLEVE
jgi:hypothetical protein